MPLVNWMGQTLNPQKIRLICVCVRCRRGAIVVWLRGDQRLALTLRTWQRDRRASCKWKGDGAQWDENQIQIKSAAARQSAGRTQNDIFSELYVSHPPLELFSICVSLFHFAAAGRVAKRRDAPAVGWHLKKANCFLNIWLCAHQERRRD